MKGFNEQIIKMKKGPKQMAIVLGSIFLFIILLIVGFFAMLAFPAFNIVVIGVTFGGGYGLFRLITSQNIEYEYSVFQGGIDIDKIISQRKRKRVVSVSGKKIESLEPYKTEGHQGKKYDRTVMAAPSLYEEGLWCFSYRSNKNGRTLVIFLPSERILEGMTKDLSGYVLREVKKNM